MTTIRRAGVAVMEIPDEILKPVFAAIGALVLAGAGWLCKRLILAPARWLKHLGAMPNNIDRLGGSLDDLRDHMVRQGLCLDVMLANGTYGVFECDLEGNNTSVNDTYCRFLGTVPHELLGKGWENFITLDERERYTKEWQTAMSSSRDYISNLELIHTEGHKVHIRVRTSKIVKHGEVVGYMGFIRLRPPGAD